MFISNTDYKSKILETAQMSIDREPDKYIMVHVHSDIYIIAITEVSAGSRQHMKRS